MKSSLPTLGIAGAVLLFLSHPSLSQVEHILHEFDLPSYPHSVHAADLDLDGDIDIVVAHTAYFAWWENTGAGHFQEHVFSSNEWVDDVSIGDLNGDGFLDILVENNLSRIPVLLGNNNGDYDYTEIDPVRCQDNYTYMDVADLDYDGDLDLAVVARNYTDEFHEDYLYTCLQQIGGHVGRTRLYGTYTGYENMLDPTLFKIDEGMRYDLFTGISDFGYVRNCKLIMNLPSQDPEIIYMSSGIRPKAVDVDNDQDMDIILIQTSVWNNTYGDASWIEQTSNGVFEQAEFIAPEFESVCSDIMPIDWDLDGNIDLAASVHNNPPYVAINDGSMNYTVAPVIQDANEALYMDVADIDNDGDPDLIILGNTLSWIENESILSNSPEIHYQQVPQLSIHTYPNPFNSSATITLDLPHPSPVNLTLVNTLGRVVWTMPNVRAGAGLQQFSVDGSSLTSGTYLLRAEIGTAEVTRRMVLLK